MKRSVGILLAILILAIPAGCKKAASPNPGGAAESSRPASSQAAASSPAAETGLQKGEAVQLTGENNDFQLHGVDFLDDGTGWMIRDRYDAGSNSYSSQLLSTADGGENWQKVGTGTDGLRLAAVRFVNRQEGWAVSQEADKTAKVPAGSTLPVRDSILHTADGGQSWTVQWKSGSDESGNSETKPALWAADARTAFALAGTKLLKTADGGKTWAAVSFGVKDFSPVQMSFTDAKTGWAAGVSAKRDMLSVLRTADGGKSWSRQFQKKYAIGGDYGPAGCAGMDFLNEKEGWFLTSDLDTWNGELYHTLDGGLHWQKAGEVKSVRPTPEGLCFLDSKTGWIPLDPGAGPIAGGLSHTRDGGKSFQTVGETGTQGGGPRRIDSAHEIVFRSAKLGWAAGSAVNYGDYLLRTQDGGKTWEQLYPKPGPTVDISFPDARTGYGLGMLSDPDALLKTEDGGESWQTVKSFSGQYLTYAISFSGPEEGWLLASPVSSTNGTADVLHTRDGGKTWQKAGKLGPPWYSTCYFRFFDANSGVAASDSADRPVYRTADGGKTWTLLSAKPPEKTAGQYAFRSASSGWQVCNPGGYGTPYRLELSRLSADGGSWQAPALAGDDAACYALAFPSDEDGFLLEEKSPGAAGIGRMELMTTADGGKTWDAHFFPEGVGGSDMNLIRSQLPMQFADGAHGWILTGGGLLATADGGRTWAWR